MNTYNIEEKDLGLLGIATKITVIAKPYVMGSSELKVFVQYQNDNNNGIWSKELEVPTDIESSWTDESIIDWVCEELGLTLV